MFIKSALLLIAALAAMHCVAGELLPPFGELPNPGKNWKLCEKGMDGDASFQWHWVTLTNSETGDVLSYAAHRSKPGEKRELIYHSDTAHEIFPAGHPTWASGPKPQLTVHSLRNRVMKIDLIDVTAKRDLSQEALEYSFVQEEERGTNRMAHGYALVFDDVDVYIQHTSTKPITPEFAYDRAASLLSSRSRDKTAQKLQPPSENLMTRFGELSPPGSPWTIRLSGSNSPVQIVRQEGGITSKTSPSTWRAKPGWFAFIENDERAWVYDGDNDLMLLSCTTRDGVPTETSYGPDSFPCAVPNGVLTRLSPAALKAIKSRAN